MTFSLHFELDKQAQRERVLDALDMVKKGNHTSPYEVYAEAIELMDRGALMEASEIIEKGLAKAVNNGRESLAKRMRPED